MNYNQFKKGYTLLFAIIVSSIVLSIAAFILSSSRRQFVLSSVARDSTMAIYAADSGAQCAYQALENGLLSTTTPNGSPQLATISCGSNTYNVQYVYVNSPPSDMSMKSKAYQFENPITIDLPNHTCTKIMVTWGYDLMTNNLKIIIDSRGYNFDEYYPCVDDPDKINQRTIERAVRLRFDR